MRSHRPAGVLPRAFRLRRHTARAGEGANLGLRRDHGSLSARLQPRPALSAAASQPAAAPRAVQPQVATTTAAAARVAAAVVRAVRAVRGALRAFPLNPHCTHCTCPKSRLFAQPTITAAEAGLDTTLTQTDEERALCLYVRALTDERVPASRCFSALSPFPPPPPPTPQSTLAALQTSLRRSKRRRGVTGDVESGPPQTDEEQYVQQHVQQNDEVHALLDRLSAENFQLREALQELRPKLTDPTDAGRRLFERLESTGSYSLEHSIKTSALSVGNGALLGLTLAQCSTLCTALKNDSEPLHSCNGVLYRMLEPSNAANLQTAYCYLLKARSNHGPPPPTAARVCTNTPQKPPLLCAAHRRMPAARLRGLHILAPRHFWVPLANGARQSGVCAGGSRPGRPSRPGPRRGQGVVPPGQAQSAPPATALVS